MKIYNSIVCIVFALIITVLSGRSYAADIDISINASSTEISYLDAFIDANKPKSFDCIDLEISGICAYVVVRVFTCPPPTFVCFSVLPEFSVELTHNNPDLLVASYRKLGNSPLDANRLLYDEIQLLLAKPILELISGEDVPVDFKRDKAWAANTSEASNNKYKSTLQYSEVDIIGHPGNIISHWWDTVEKDMLPIEGVPQAILGSLEEGATRIPTQVSDAAQVIALPEGQIADTVTNIDQRWAEHPLSTSLVNQSDNTFVTTVAGLASMFSDFNIVPEDLEEISDILNDVVFDTLDSVSSTWDEINEGIELLDQISEITGTIESTGGNYGPLTNPIFSFCPTDSKLLKPYFLSGANIIQWRYNIPEIVYPQSYKTSYIESHQKDFIANGTHTPNDNFWGPLFPRNGYVLQPDSMKASAVAAVRGVHVATREYFVEGDTNQIHVYSPLRKRTNHGKGIKMVSQPGPYSLEDKSTGQWQLMGSKSDDRCIKFGEGDLTQSGTLQLSSGDEVQRDDLPWTHDKQSDDNNYVWTLWREYTCCPTPTRNSDDIFFEYFDLPTVPLGIDLL